MTLPIPNVYIVGHQTGEVLVMSKDLRFNGGFKYPEPHATWPFEPSGAQRVWCDSTYKYHCQNPQIHTKEERNYVVLQVIKGGLS